MLNIPTQPEKDPLEMEIEEAKEGESTAVARSHLKVPQVLLEKLPLIPDKEMSEILSSIDDIINEPERTNEKRKEKKEEEKRKEKKEEEKRKEKKKEEKRKKKKEEEKRKEKIEEKNVNRRRNKESVKRRKKKRSVKRRRKRRRN